MDKGYEQGEIGLKSRPQTCDLYEKELLLTEGGRTEKENKDENQRKFTINLHQNWGGVETSSQATRLKLLRAERSHEKIKRTHMGGSTKGKATRIYQRGMETERP